MGTPRFPAEPHGKTMEAAKGGSSFVAPSTDPSPIGLCCRKQKTNSDSLESALEQATDVDSLPVSCRGEHGFLADRGHRSRGPSIPRPASRASKPFLSDWATFQRSKDPAVVAGLSQGHGDNEDGSFTTPGGATAAASCGTHSLHFPLTRILSFQARSASYDRK